MKFWILTLTFVTFAEANLFAVKDGNTTCLLLQLNGSLALRPNISGEVPVTFSFEDASLITNTSNCTLVKLNLAKSVEVWFQFNGVNNNTWSVTPLAQFIPHSVFNSSTHNGTLVYTAAPLEDNFNKTESYQCNASSTLTFNNTEGEMISVIATVSNFTIQSLSGSQFVPGKNCKEDNPTPAPTTATTPKTSTTATTPTTPTTRTTATPKTTVAPTTPKPSNAQNFSCSNVTAATTKFRVIGTFSLSVTYNATIAGKNQSKTVTIEVPRVTAEETNCSSESNESLTFWFFDNWSIEYIFQAKSKQKYYVSNITITYVHDEHLPNSTHPNKNVTVHFGKEDYLEASTSGYYSCQVKTNLAINEVTLHTEGFKYKAFNDKGDISFSSGDVTECQNDEQTSNVVPIAVGATLAGLVVIVLIAYLIGRKRSRKAGYESV